MRSPDRGGGSRRSPWNDDVAVFPFFLLGFLISGVAFLVDGYPKMRPHTMKRHLVLALIPLVSGTTAPGPSSTDSSVTEISKSCQSYAQALEVLHILDQQGDRGVNVVQGRRGVKAGDVWEIIWRSNGREAEKDGEGTVSLSR
jgi:hypothetical protein